MLAILLDLFGGWVAARFVRNLALAIVCAALVGAAASAISSYLLYLLQDDLFSEREIAARALVGLVWHPSIAIAATLLFRWKFKSASVATTRLLADDAPGSSFHFSSKQSLSVILGSIVFGAALGAVYLWFSASSDEIGRLYSVHDIVDYDDNDEGNVSARMQVYLSGTTGHTKDITCLFPPTTKIVEARADHIRLF